MYLTYLEEGGWFENADRPEPKILLICYDQRSLRYVKKAIKTAFNDFFDSDIPFYYTTKENIYQYKLDLSLWKK